MRSCVAPRPRHAKAAQLTPRYPLAVGPRGGRFHQQHFQLARGRVAVHEAARNAAQVLPWGGAMGGEPVRRPAPPCGQASQTPRWRYRDIRKPGEPPRVDLQAWQGAVCIASCHAWCKAPCVHAAFRTFCTAVASPPPVPTPRPCLLPGCEEVHGSWPLGRGSCHAHGCAWAPLQKEAEAT